MTGRGTKERLTELAWWVCFTTLTLGFATAFVYFADLA
jgi:hypothetical protein